MGTVEGTAARWDADPGDRWFTASIGELLVRRAQETPSSAALHWIDDAGDLHTWAYRELHARADASAARLRQMLNPGARLALCAPSSPSWIVVEHACALAGVVVVPVNPAMGDAEIEHILATSSAEVVITVDSFRGAPVRDRLERLVEGVDPRPGVQDLDDVVAARDAPRAGTSPVTDSARPFLVQYTSGTTGRPKGAVLTHFGALNSAATWAAGWDLSPDDVFVTPVPLHHVGGSVACVLGNLAAGSSIGLIPAYSPGGVIAMLEATGATVLAAVPTMLFDLQRDPGFDPDRLSALRVIVGGGAAVPEAMVRSIERTFGVEFIVSYGQSESPAILQTRPGDSDAVKAGTLGRPLPGREVEIRSLERGVVVALGEVGEICARSSMQMTEYLGMPEETASVLDADGWLHTGDLGSMDADGNVTFCGRARDVIIRGGENIYPDQVEAAYASCPGVGAVVVVGVPDERYGEVPVGVVVLEPDHVLDAEALELHGREHLAAYQVPRRWVAVDALPLTASGKVRKAVLRGQLGEAGDAR